MMSGRIRLGCLFCDRNDYDGVRELPGDWTDIDEVQSFEESIKPIDIDDSHGDVTFWQTHMRGCPDCLRQEPID